MYAIPGAAQVILKRNGWDPTGYGSVTPMMVNSATVDGFTTSCSDQATQSPTFQFWNAPDAEFQGPTSGWTAHWRIRFPEPLYVEKLVTNKADYGNAYPTTFEYTIIWPNGTTTQKSGWVHRLAVIGKPETALGVFDIDAEILGLEIWAFQWKGWGTWLAAWPTYLVAPCKPGPRFMVKDGDLIKTYQNGKWSEL